MLQANTIQSVIILAGGSLQSCLLSTGIVNQQLLVCRLEECQAALVVEACLVVWQALRPKSSKKNWSQPNSSKWCKSLDCGGMLCILPNTNVVIGKLVLIPVLQSHSLFEKRSSNANQISSSWPPGLVIVYGKNSLSQDSDSNTIRVNSWFKRTYGIDCTYISGTTILKVTHT